MATDNKLTIGQVVLLVIFISAVIAIVYCASTGGGLLRVLW